MFKREWMTGAGGDWRAPLRLSVLLLWAGAAAAAFHGARGLYETTEGRYARCAQEMRQSGAWLVPVLNGRPHWTKPPPAYWAIGGPVAALGPTAWAVRLYLIPCYLVTVAAVWRLALLMWGERRTAGACAVVYATMATPLLATQAVTTDYLLTAALAVAQAALWAALRGGSAGAAVHLFWGCMGAAFLVKGPPALLALPAAVAAWLRLPEARRGRVPLFSPTALALFLAVGGSWYAWAAWRHPGLLGYWFRDEVVERVLTDKHFRNPFFYCNFTVYLPVLLLGSLPWSGVLAWRWREVWGRLRGGGGDGVRSAWLLWAVLFPLAVFMLSRSKLPLYVLPLFVPLAAGAGRLLAGEGFGRWGTAAAGAVFALFVAGKAVAARLPHERNMLQLHRTLAEYYGVRDPSRLAVAGPKPLNGLSFYYGAAVTNLPWGALEEWSAGGGERFLICDHWKAADARRRLGGGAAEEYALPGRRRLVRLPGNAPAEEGR